MAPGPRRFFVGIQGLRALAALSIVFSHVSHDGIAAGLDPRGVLSRLSSAFPWDSGVDLFFVISGFIIASASGSLFGTGRAGIARFLRRRCERIVPLYWSTTALFLLTALTAPRALHGAFGGAAWIAASFAFIPWPRPDGEMQPALGLGWTLNYEMFFYLLFAVSLALPRRRALAGLLACLLLIAAAGARFHPANPQLAFWSSPLILEFGAGLALAWLRGRLRLPPALQLLAVAAALLWLHAHAGVPESTRVTAWGPAAVLLVAAAALGAAPQAPGRAGQMIILLGEASYALYLTHPFIMRLLSISFHKFHGHSETLGLMYVASGLALAQLGALAVHQHLDAPLQARFRRHRAEAPHETLQMSGL
jgi:peptidoglycan/LPS O-acetylase OafA/YrhL